MNLFFNISTNFIKYLLCARKCGLWDKSLYLLITLCMPNTVESTFYIYFNTHNTSLWGRFIITHRKKLKYRKVNKWFVQGSTANREWWHRSLNLWRMSWEPRCPATMISFLTRYNHIPWAAPTLVKEPEQRQIINIQCYLCSIKVWEEHCENAEEGGNSSAWGIILAVISKVLKIVQNFQNMYKPGMMKICCSERKV